VYIPAWIQAHKYKPKWESHLGICDTGDISLHLVTVFMVMATSPTPPSFFTTGLQCFLFLFLFPSSIHTLNSFGHGAMTTSGSSLGLLAAYGDESDESDGECVVDVSICDDAELAVSSFLSSLSLLLPKKYANILFSKQEDYSTLSGDEEKEKIPIHGHSGDWTRLLDMETGLFYYWNEKSGERTWRRPPSYAEEEQGETQDADDDSASDCCMTGVMKEEEGGEGLNASSSSGACGKVGDLPLLHREVAISQCTIVIHPTNMKSFMGVVNVTSQWEQTFGGRVERIRSLSTASGGREMFLLEFPPNVASSASLPESAAMDIALHSWGIEVLRGDRWSECTLINGISSCKIFARGAAAASMQENGINCLKIVKDFKQIRKQLVERDVCSPSDATTVRKEGASGEDVSFVSVVSLARPRKRRKSSSVPEADEGPRVKTTLENAQKGLQSPWKAFHDYATGLIYYGNLETKQRTWKRPSLE
jgi:hypothetical protein